jgi:hypothetical protein
MLVGLSSAALVIAIVVSGSRTLLASVAIVVLCGAGVAALIRPKLILRLLQGVVVTGIVVFVASQLELFQEGIRTLTSRIDGASQYEGGAGGFLERAFHGFLQPFELWSEVPLFGSGLGMGTNVGAKLITGNNHQFLLAEVEWSRVIMESGPLLGSLYLMLRLVITVAIYVQALRITRLRGDALSLLLFSSCAMPLINGEWGQSTTLGFAVFASGLALAAMNPGRCNAAIPQYVTPTPLTAGRRIYSVTSSDRGPGGA